MDEQFEDPEADKPGIPAEPGYYWHRDIDEGCGEAFEWEVLLVMRDHAGDLNISIDKLRSPYLAVSDVAGEWGPRIPDPEEMREAQADAAVLDLAVARGVKRATDMIRDDLAKEFLVGILTRGANTSVATNVDQAYKYADAMMAERKQRG